MTDSIRVPDAGQFTAALTGLAVGDALGRPVEGKRHDEIRAMGGDVAAAYRAYHDPKLGRDLAPGSWSDDTQQALLLADSLVAHRGLDAHDFADRMYALWRSSEARGYGGIYETAMRRRDAGQPWDAVAVDDQLVNGAAMRIAPLGLFYWYDAAALTEAAVRSAHVTHSHPASDATAAAVAHAVAYALTHVDAPHDADALVAYLQRQIAPVDRATADHLDVLPRATALPPDDAFEVLSTVPGFASPPRPGRGFGVGPLGISLLLSTTYLFLHARGDFRRAVETAILLGGDTDGVAGVAGALCGAWSGPDSIPRRMADGAEEIQRIRTVAVLLYERSMAASRRT
jgi:poly(ADP-ribose) glycohydrolase ARH3